MPTFLQNAFLFGMIAMAVPILIHLFFRLKTKRVDLGTIRFLRVVLEENARRRKVMRWLLLALRVSFVALLAALFARPFLTAAATSGEKELLVILIDQSATMQLKSDNSRLIELAVAEARKLVERAGRNTRIEVAFFDHVIHPLKPATDSASADSLLQQLQAPAASYGATNYGVAFEWARDLLVNAPGKKQFHLFTDLQRSGLDWTEVEPLPADAESHLHDLGRSVVNNVAVTEVRIPRTWIRPNEAPTVRASVLHGGAFALEEVAIVMEVGRVDDAVAGRAEPAKGRTTEFARLAERITKRERVKLEPGATVTLDFELPSLGAGLWQGRVTVEHDDDLPFDNQRNFAISAAPPYRVLIVNGNSDNTPIISETYFLEAALRLAPPGESFDDSPFAPDVTTHQPGEVLPNLADFDAVILANVGVVTPEDALQLGTFVRGGGGLLVFTGDTVSAKGYEAFRNQGLAAGELGEPQVARDLPWRLSRWDEKHPIFQPLSDPQHGDLRRLIFAAYTKITPASDTAVLAEFSTGAPAVLERHLGKGTVLWVSTSCGREWGDWCRSRLFLPTVHQLLGYQVGLTQGGRVRSRLVDLDDRGQKPEGKEQESASVAPVSIPGVTQFERYAEVVNVSPRESDVDRCSQQDFEDRFAVKFRAEDGGADPQAAALANVEFRQDELWHWVACALLAVLLLEGFVGNRTTA